MHILYTDPREEVVFMNKSYGYVRESMFYRRVRELRAGDKK